MKETEATNRSQMIKNLEVMASFLPGAIYWKSKSGVYLGINEFVLAMSGFQSADDIIGKNDYDLWPQFAHNIVEHDQKVMRTGLPLQTEERITQPDGKVVYFAVIKIPLYDDDRSIIGIIGNSLDITEQKRKKIRYLEDLAPSIPGQIYWKNRNSVYLGMNQFALEASGLKDFSDFIGKTDYDLWPQFADELVLHDQEVMRSGKAIHREEAITLPTGEIRHFTAIKVPLRDDDNNIIGVIGNSIDITAQKEAEQLRIENETHKSLAKEQEKFTQLANKVAHDIRSPLASLTMIVKSCTQIPEGDRIALREAAITIGDIANHLLHHYQKKDKADANESEERQPILISAILLESLSAKKYQYGNLPAKFDFHFKSHSHFAFIKAGASAFKRMLSNLINNAVDAFDNQPGEIDLKLETDNEWVKIFIQDTGKGMPPELIDKIMHKTAVTEGKKSGHGIGLTQVWETLEHNHGEMHIISERGKGTTITLTFPRVRAPYWIAEEIVLNSNDTVIILDDDSSIHGAWRARFEGILNEHKQLQLEHFQVGLEALEFIQSLAPENKEKVFLLSDYELLRQELNGLHVIAQSGIQRSILVTSHYANLEVQKEAAKTGTKILPKQLASEIVIKINEAATIGTNEGEKVTAIIVDDDKPFVEDLILYAFDDDEIVDDYQNPEHFLNNVEKYPKDTKIYLDNNYATSELKGLDVAKELHELGYTQIYLLSGEVFNEDDLPNYVTLIGKNNIEKLKKL